MTRIYSSLDWMAVHNLKNVLESHGIACEVKGEFRSSAMGMLPPSECLTELWVLDDTRVQEAMSILSQPAQTIQQNAQAWICPACGEVSEGQFDQCWQCGTARTSQP